MNDTGARVIVGSQRTLGCTLMDQGEGKQLTSGLWGLVLFVRAHQDLHLGIWGVATEDPPITIPEARFQGTVVSMGRYKAEEDLFKICVRTSAAEAENLFRFIESKKICGRAGHLAEPTPLETERLNRLEGSNPSPSANS